MTNYNDLTAREKEAFVMLPIIEELKQLAGKPLMMKLNEP